MTALASDAFTRADNTTLGANWTLGTGDPGTFDIVSNQAKTHDDHDASIYYSGIAWPNDHYSKANISATTNFTTDDGSGFCVRRSAAARTYYRSTFNHSGTGNVQVSKEIAGAYTNLSSGTQVWTDGDVAQFDVQGTALRAKLSGSTIVSTTDSSLTTGNSGLFYSSEVGLGDATHFAIWDNWEGGDFATASVITQMNSGAMAEVGTCI